MFQTAFPLCRPSVLRYSSKTSTAAAREAELFPNQLQIGNAVARQVLPHPKVCGFLSGMEGGNGFPVAVFFQTVYREEYGG